MSALRGDRLNVLQLTEVSLDVFANCVPIGYPRTADAATVTLRVQPRPTVVIA